MHFPRLLINLIRWVSRVATKEEEEGAWKKILNDLVSTDGRSMTELVHGLTVCAEGGNA